jgi:hypothetical protein
VIEKWYAETAGQQPSAGGDSAPHEETPESGEEG